jgi:hypothetical protein
LNIVFTLVAAAPIGPTLPRGERDAAPLERAGHRH